VLADTCHGNGIGVEVTVKARPDNLVNLYLARALQKEGLGSIEASDVHQMSHAGSQWNGGGAFTYYLIKGLSGKADSDGDGTVTAGELFTYVQMQVTKDTMDEQLPIAEDARSGNVALAGLLTTSQWMILSAVHGGRISCPALSLRPPALSPRWRYPGRDSTPS
jgi:uncharacterized caspase-like protein